MITNMIKDTLKDTFFMKDLLRTRNNLCTEIKISIRMIKIAIQLVKYFVKRISTKLRK